MLYAYAYRSLYCCPPYSDKTLFCPPLSYFLDEGLAEPLPHSYAIYAQTVMRSTNHRLQVSIGLTYTSTLAAIAITNLVPP